MKKGISKSKYILGVVLIFISSVIITSMNWSNRVFSVTSFDQIVFHIKVPMDGSDSSIFWHWLVESIPSSIFRTLIVVMIVVVLERTYQWVMKKYSTKPEIPKFITERKFKWLGISLLVSSIVIVTANYNVFGYVKSVRQKTLIYEEYYVDPSTVDINFSNGKRNLIHIYVESMESTFVSQEAGGAYEIGYTDELEYLANNYINFSHNDAIGGNMQVTGTGWTVAAMVAQSTGLPLTIPIYGNSYGQSSTFLPGAHSIGTVLQNEGYQQQLLIGSDATFGGRSNFYTQHGDYDIVDYHTIHGGGRIPPNYSVFWGFEDEKLFQFAKEDILVLAENDQPFNMTMLTVDAHSPEGYLSESCPVIFDSQYENVLACNSSQIYQFVRWIQEQDFYEDTTIVIAGDHLSMASWFFEDLDPDFIRTPYNVIINSAVEPQQEKNRIFTSMDWYPTILAAMGAEIEGDRLGLGTNLFSDKSTLIEEKGIDYINEELLKTSDFYNNRILITKD